MRLLWRGFGGGYGRLGNYWKCWHLQRWEVRSARDLPGTRHYGFGPIVLILPAKKTP